MAIKVWTDTPEAAEYDAAIGMNLPLADDAATSIEVRGDLARYVGQGAAEAVKHWTSKLAPGGTLRIAVPDFDALTDAYRDGTCDSVEPRLLGAAGENGSIWNRQKLHDAMRQAGLEEVRDWPAGVEPWTVALEGRKVPAISELRNVEALISMPRLAWTENMFCAIQALVPLKVNLTKHTGAFWGQCLSRLIETAIAKPGCEWILTLDYDTIFSRDDVASLYRLATSQGLDAVAAMQVGRDRQTVLITVHDENGNARSSLLPEEIERDALEVETAHFGLTLINAAKLRELPKPWFHGQPAPDGSWGDGRIDDDIAFWRQWKRAGNRVWQANRVRIGHMQTVVTWPDRRLAARHQYHSEYVTDGKPPYAR
jgi:hypothetical protein